MTRNRNLIAAQVVISAIALAVVFATLLNPDTDDPLSGVEAPNQLAPNGGDQDGKRAASQDGGSGGAGGAGGATGVLTAAPPGSGPAFEAFAPGSLAPGAGITPEAVTDDGPRDGSEDDGPPSIQYRSTLDQLRARLNSD